MCLFPLFAGPIEIPLVPASPLYAWRRSIGFWLRFVAVAHLLLSAAWFTCFQVRDADCLFAGEQLAALEKSGCPVISVGGGAAQGILMVISKSV